MHLKSSSIDSALLKTPSPEFLNNIFWLFRQFNSRQHSQTLESHPTPNLNIKSYILIPILLEY